MQNPFVWHDLMTTDVEGAKTFYQKVIGWHFSSQDPGYNVTLVGEHGVGGIMETPEHLKGMPPFWYGYVYTPDVEAACKQVIEFGGKVLRQSWDIEETIRIAVIADPDGAVLNIMQPLSKEGRTWPAELLAGTSCMLAISMRRGTSIPKCLAGSKDTLTTWAGQRASISSFKSTAKTSVA
jgi:predicted enzyme related to lactoylglutathione lyase